MNGIHELLTKTSAAASSSFAMRGQLYCSQSGWLLLHVPNNLVYGVFASLRLPGIEPPPSDGNAGMNAHISVMSAEDMEAVGGPSGITERGQEFSYTLGPLKSVVPTNWEDVERVWFLSVNSPELEQLRKSYGLPALPHGGKHPFHITVAVRKRGILQANGKTKNVISLPAILRQRGTSGTEKSEEADGSRRIRLKYAMSHGIPDPSDYGDLSRLPIGQIVDLVLQEHSAVRAGKHTDVRIGTPETGLFSWAMRKAFPGPRTRAALWRQPLHSWGYGDFQGIIHGSGYGAGTVRKKHRGKLLITAASPERIEFTTADERYSDRFVLLKPKAFTDRGWLLVNVTPQDIVPSKKVHYKRIPADQVDPLISQMTEGDSMQAKIDGAASLVRLLRNGIEIVSYRPSAQGRPLVHTERILHGKPKQDIPPELVGSVLKGELYGVRGDDGKAIPPQELGGLLNATLANSLKAQQNRNIRLKTMLYDIQRAGKKDVSFEDVPYRERMGMLERVLPHLPSDVFHLPDEARTGEQARQLWDAIRTGKHPLTEEGIVFHPSTGKPSKAKLLEEQDVYITGTFPGGGKYKDVGAGGFTYATSPGGSDIGRVGTGLSDALRREMVEDPRAFVGRVARVRSQGAFPGTGALRAPALLALHEG